MKTHIKKDGSSKIRVIFNDGKTPPLLLDTGDREKNIDLARRACWNAGVAEAEFDGNPFDLSRPKGDPLAEPVDHEWGIKIYTGIGSRKTPPEALSLMRRFAEVAAKKGAILRSGGARGADSAFEIGCDAGGGKKEIYLPWAKFNDNASSLYGCCGGAFSIASRVHPNWEACGPGAQKLHARNVYQVIGKTLDTPSDVVIGWTEGGELVGGTATALRLAMNLGEYVPGLVKEIPILNLGLPEHVEIVEDMIQKA